MALVWESLMSTPVSPGVLRAGSERRTSHNGDRAERRPGYKYTKPYIYATTQRAAHALRRLCRRIRSRVEMLRVNAARVLHQVMIASQLEQPWREQYLRRVEGSARANSVGAAWANYFKESLVWRHHSSEPRLPDSRKFGLKIRYVDRAATIKKVASRAWYATAILPYAGLVRSVARTIRAYQSDVCQVCGKHTAEYVKCDAYRFVRWNHFLDATVETLLYGFSNDAWAEAYLLLDRDVALLEGRSWVIFTDMRNRIEKTLVAGVPVVRKIKMTYAVVSAVFFVATGSHLGYWQWLNDYGGNFEFPVTTMDIDSMIYLLGHTYSFDYDGARWRVISAGISRIYGIPHLGPGSVTDYLKRFAPLMGVRSYWAWFTHTYPHISAVYEERLAGYYR